MLSRKPRCGVLGVFCLRVGVACLFVLSVAGCDGDKKASRLPVVKSEPSPQSVKAVEKPHDAHRDWCTEHAVPESMCAECNSGLEEGLKKSGDWCEEHGHAESVCPVCNPQAPPAEAHGDWCVEHGLPESKCTKCSPNLVVEFKKSGDWCEAHGFPDSVCPSCNPQPPPVGAEKAALESRIIRFRTPELEKVAGISATKAKRGEAQAAVQCVGTIQFDADRVADVRSTAPGIVRGLRVTLGTEVKKGAPLFDLESSRVGESQGAFAIAREEERIAELNLARQRELRAEGISSVRQVELAEQGLVVAKAKVGAAQSSLRMAGAPAAQSSGRYTLRAPITGVVVRRPAVLGLLATEETSLATIGDASVMWALCEVPESESSRIAIGQHVLVSTRAEADLHVEGELAWIASEVNPRTRTVTARAEVPNSEGRLRANQFARVTIKTGSARSAIVVPRESIQRIGELEVVFVRTQLGVYEPRVVERLGARGDEVDVEGTLKAGEEVVTTGAVLLRTEAVPGSIGAGCCEIDGGEGE